MPSSSTIPFPAAGRVPLGAREEHPNHDECARFRPVLCAFSRSTPIRSPRACRGSLLRRTFLAASSGRGEKDRTYPDTSQTRKNLRPMRDHRSCYPTVLATAFRNELHRSNCGRRSRTGIDPHRHSVSPCCWPVASHRPQTSPMAAYPSLSWIPRATFKIRIVRKAIVGLRLPILLNATLNALIL